MSTLIKQITAKVYDIDNTTYSYTINPSTIINKISFSSNINGGQGNLKLQLNKSWEQTDISVGKILKVYEIDENNPTGRLIYTGIIQRLSRILDVSTEQIEIEAIGLGGALSFIYYYDSSYSFNKTGEPATLINNIMTFFNTEYSNLISAGTLTNYGTNIDIDFDYTTCLDAINNIKNTTDQRFYVDQNGTLDFKEKASTPDHYVTVAKDVEKVVVPEDTIDLVNEYILEWSSGTTTTTDATSETNYGLRQLYENKSEIGDSTSATQTGNNYIANNKDPRKKTTIIVNSNYDITTIKPGQTVKLRNTAYEISNLQVVRTTYQVDTIILELEGINNLTEQIIKS